MHELPTIVDGLISDEKGRFLFEDIDLGTYTVKINFIGYETQLLDLELSKDYPVKNLKTINEVVKDVAFIQPKASPKLAEGGVITGFIRAYLGVFTRPGRMLTAAYIV